MRRWKPCREPLWTELPGGGFHPFGMRARKVEVLWWTGLWDGAITLLERELSVTSANGLARERAVCLFTLGGIESHRGNWGRAEASLAEAAGLYESIGDRDGGFSCRARLIRLYLGTKRFREGEDLTEKLLAEARGSGDRNKEVLMLNNQGMVCMHTGRPGEAISLFEMVIKVYQETGDLWAVAHTIGNIGNVHCDMGEYQEAAHYYERSLKLCRRTGNTYSEYYVLYNLAYTSEMIGEYGKALEHYRADLALARQLGDGPGAEQILGDIARVKDAVKAQ